MNRKTGNLEGCSCITVSAREGLPAASSHNPTLPDSAWSGPPGRSSVSAAEGEPVEFFIRQTAEFDPFRESRIEHKQLSEIDPQVR